MWMGKGEINPDSGIRRTFGGKRVRRKVDFAKQT